MLYLGDRIVIPRTLRREVLEKVHNESHFGQARTLGLVKRSYLWYKMARDVRIFCKGCAICQRTKPNIDPKQPLERFSRAKAQPGAWVALDIGTLPWGDGMFRYFALIVELLPLRDQTAESIAEAFRVGWIFRGHGIPDVLLTDQGKNVDGHEIRDLCKKLRIHKRHSSPYHPQADGMAERNIGTAKLVIRSLLMEREMEKGVWLSALPEVSYLMNNVKNTTTKVSPHMITFGRQPRALTDLGSRNLDSEESSPQDYWEALQDVQKELTEAMTSNEDKRFSETKRRYDKGKRSTNIRPSNSIFLEVGKRDNSLSAKFDGPYLALDQKGSNVLVELPRGSKWYHVDRCKRFERKDELFIPSQVPTLRKGSRASSQKQYWIQTRMIRPIWS